MKYTDKVGVKIQMKLRMLIVGLLLVALFLPISSLPLASSQTTGTSTTMTISQPPSQGQCSILTLAFSAHTGEQITGTFGSDASINFYILSQNDLNAIQNCRLEPTVRPIFIEEKSVGHNNPYRSLSFPANGTYYFVFLYVRGPTQLTKGYATVELSFPPSVVIMGTIGRASIPTSSTLLSTTPLTSTSATSASSATSISTTLSLPASTMAPTTSTTSALTETPSTSFAVLGMPLTSLLLIIGGIIIAGGGLIGLTLFRNRKRRTLSSYLARIDSTYNEFAVDREECRTQLERLKSNVIEMLNKGKIDEGHFLMLDEKITEYLKDLTQPTAKYKRPPGTDDGNASVSPQPATQVKYCSNCGAKLSADDKVCKRCGTTQ